MVIKKDVINAQFPVGGVTRRVSLQSASPYVCYEALNVFPDCVYLERERGGSRAPLITDWSVGSGQINFINELGYLDGADVKRILCVGTRGGKLYTIDGTTVTEIGSGLNTGPTLTGDAHLGEMFIARGSDANESIMVFNPGAGTLVPLTATVGTAPIKSKILIQWRDRLVVADGEDPHNIYMSRQGDPYDWDFIGSDPGDPQRPIDVSATVAGKIGQPVRALIPHSNNCLVIATDNEFYVMRGDPTAGGRIMLIQNVLGIMGRRAWCHSPDGFMWTMTHDGLYVMPPGCGDPLHSVSREKLPQELVNYDPDDYIVTMAFCPRMRGVLVFMTEDSASGGSIDPPYCGLVNQGSLAPKEASIQVTHFFVDIRNTQSSDATNKFAASFWPMSMGSGAEPTYAVTNHTVGNEPGTYFGTRNSKISHFERTINSKSHPWPTTDGVNADSEGGAFHSYVMLGPFTTGKGGAVGVLEQIRGFMSRDSKPVEYEVYAGDNAEEPLHVDPVFTGTFDLSGTNYAEHCRIRAKYFYILIKDIKKENWALEGMQLKRQHRSGRERIHYPLEKTNQLVHDTDDVLVVGVGNPEDLVTFNTDRVYGVSGETKIMFTWRVHYQNSGTSTIKSILSIGGVVAWEESEDLDNSSNVFQYTENYTTADTIAEGVEIVLSVEITAGGNVTVLNSVTPAKVQIFEID